MRNMEGWSKGFDWSSYFSNQYIELYKMVVNNTNEIQGVIAIELCEGYIEVHLVESAPHNRGKNKEFDFVGPHLFAFACKRSVEAGFEGFIAMTAKTRLIEHYTKILGAQLIHSKTNRMFIPEVAAEILIRVYLD